MFIVLVQEIVKIGGHNREGAPTGVPINPVPPRGVQCLFVHQQVFQYQLRGVHARIGPPRHQGDVFQPQCHSELRYQVVDFVVCIGETVWNQHVDMDFIQVGVKYIKVRRHVISTSRYDSYINVYTYRTAHLFWLIAKSIESLSHFAHNPFRVRWGLLRLSFFDLLFQKCNDFGGISGKSLMSGRWLTQWSTNQSMCFC